MSIPLVVTDLTLEIKILLIQCQDKVDPILAGILQIPHRHKMADLTLAADPILVLACVPLLTTAINSRATILIQLIELAPRAIAMISKHKTFIAATHKTQLVAIHTIQIRLHLKIQIVAILKIVPKISSRQTIILTGRSRRHLSAQNPQPILLKIGKAGHLTKILIVPLLAQLPHGRCTVLCSPASIAALLMIL